MRKMITGLILGVLLAVLPSVPVFAVPADITFVTLTPSNTSIVIRWHIAASSTSTLVRYSTTAYPATTADGTQAYSGTDYEYALSSLTAGTTYYFSAWGYDGANYSATAAHAVTTTTATVVPDGGAPDAQSDVVAFPAWQAPQAPDVSGFQLEPISTLIAYFQSAPGGLNMPVANIWETLFIFGLVALGGFLYVKTKNFFVAFVAVIALTWVGADRELCQWELLYIEAFIAAAVFAVERVFG